MATKRVHLGDSGTTQISMSSTRVLKSNSILNFYNQLDKVNATLNIILNLLNQINLQEIEELCNKHTISTNLKKLLKINSNIIASFFCQKLKVTDNDLTFMERLATNLELQAPAKDFVWIYHNIISSWFNMARVEIRRAEHLYYVRFYNNKKGDENLEDQNKLPFNDSLIKKILNRESTIFFHYALVLEKCKQE